MSTRHDHPVTILREFTGELPTGHQEKGGVIRAREVLEAYQHEHGVTFEALDKEAFAVVKEAWERLTSLPEGPARTAAQDDFFNGTRDLLGLEG